jgi:hypothetical protein
MSQVKNFLMRPTLLPIANCSVKLEVIFCVQAVRAPVIAAFQKLQSLAGDWQGKDEQGNSVKSTFAPIASKTAVMETLTLPGMHGMVTLYSVDIDSIALIHYCPTNNQPRMRAVPPAGPIKELVFSFQGAGNLRDLAAGHEHKLVIRFVDRDHIVEQWTWRREGKDTETVLNLVRTHSGASDSR